MFTLQKATINCTYVLCLRKGKPSEISGFSKNLFTKLEC